MYLMHVAVRNVVKRTRSSLWASASLPLFHSSIHLAVFKPVVTGQAPMRAVTAFPITAANYYSFGNSTGNGDAMNHNDYQKWAEVVRQWQLERERILQKVPCIPVRSERYAKDTTFEDRLTIEDRFLVKEMALILSDAASPRISTPGSWLESSRIREADWTSSAWEMSSHWLLVTFCSAGLVSLKHLRLRRRVAGGKRRSSHDQIFVALVVHLEFHLALVDSELNGRVGRKDVAVGRLGLANFVFRGCGVNNILVAQDRRRGFLAVVLRPTLDRFLRNNSARLRRILRVTQTAANDHRDKDKSF